MNRRVVENPEIAHLPPRVEEWVMEVELIEARAMARFASGRGGKKS